LAPEFPKSVLARSLTLNVATNTTAKVGGINEDTIKNIGKVTAAAPTP
jgi:hypothetical protein